MADPDASWPFGDEDNSTSTGNAVASGQPEGTLDGSAASSIPTGPPVHNPYAHILETPHVTRPFTHWARKKHLQYNYLTDYSQIYYDDYVDYLDKKAKKIHREVPRPREWAERSLKLYAKEGERLIDDYHNYWETSKNKVKDRSSIFHVDHSKDYYHRQYKDIMC